MGNIPYLGVGILSFCRHLYGYFGKLGIKFTVINGYLYEGGINLDDFEIAIAPYDLVITFNGSSFDLPYIRRWFPMSR